MSSPGGTSWLGRFAAASVPKPIPPRAAPQKAQEQQQQHAHSAPAEQQSLEPSTVTQKKVEAAKTYIENLYKNQAKSLQQRMERRMSVEQEVGCPHASL